MLGLKLNRVSKSGLVVARVYCCMTSRRTGNPRQMSLRCGPFSYRSERPLTDLHRAASRSVKQTNIFSKLFNSFSDFFHFWHDCWPWPIDYLIRFWSIFVVTLSLNCEGQIWNLLCLSQKWSDCHETKCKHIDWTPGLKCDRVWPWPWPWPWIFKVKYWTCYISSKNGPIFSKWKANISIEL